MIDLEPQLITDDSVVYRISGDLDFEAAPAAGVGIAILEMQHPQKLILDLNDVDMIDSAGLRVIVDAASRARAGGRELTIVAGRRSKIRRLLTLVGLDLRVPIVDEHVLAP
jgi:stage II sporulation protein AA (anti-sigma F factor antagonist)